MNKNFLKQISFISLLVLVVASCKVTHTYQTPEVQIEGLFVHQYTAPCNNFFAFLCVLRDLVVQHFAAK